MENTFEIPKEDAFHRAEKRKRKVSPGKFFIRAMGKERSRQGPEIRHLIPRGDRFRGKLVWIAIIPSSGKGTVRQSN